jgi:DNA-binding MarR family transcriptional regulator
MMIWGTSPAAVAGRFTAVAQALISDGPAERTDRARRKLLASIAHLQPATLNQVAEEVGRGAPAVSRSVESLVRAGLVERTPDPDNRRRLALRLTDEGKALLERPPVSGNALTSKLERIAPSELRAVERAIEILERGP